MSAAVSVVSVTLQPSPAILEAGEAGYFTVSVTDAAGNALTGRPVSWQSASPSIAAVVDDGLEIGISPGTTTITATAEGKSGSATLVVAARSGASVCAQIDSASMYGWDERDYTVLLGRLTNRFDSQSIYNSFGTTGRRYSSTSIHTSYGTWGSPYSNRSAFDPYASR